MNDYAIVNTLRHNRTDSSVDSLYKGHAYLHVLVFSGVHVYLCSLRFMYDCSMHGVGLPLVFMCTCVL